MSATYRVQISRRGSFVDDSGSRWQWPEFSAPIVVEVSASSMQEALVLASELPLEQWKDSR